MDRYDTSLRLNPGAIIQAVVSSIPNEQANQGPKKSTFKQRVLGLFKGQNEMARSTADGKLVYGILAHVEEMSVENDAYFTLLKGAHIYCSPQSIPPYLKNSIGSQTPIILQEDLVITPDYSHLSSDIVTTGDYFAIHIKKGALVVIRKGGQIGNIHVYVQNGNISVTCNPDIKVPYARLCG